MLILVKSGTMPVSSDLLMSMDKGCTTALLCIWISWSHKHVITSPLGGGCEVLFSPGLCLCVCVCMSVCVSVCPANILLFYFSAIRRDIDLKIIQDTYRVVLNSL